MTRKGSSEACVVVHLDGTEFAVVVRGPQGSDRATAAIAKQIAQAMRLPLEVDGRVLTASVKPCEQSDSGETRAAQSNNPSQTEAASDMAALLRGAVDRQEFNLIYQPIVNLNTFQPIGVEALLRWYSTHLGEVSPETFIPEAERTGLIHTIGEWVLREACRTASNLIRQTQPRAFFISVNVSPHQLAAPNFPDIVAEVLAETHLSPGYLLLEITETAPLTNRGAILRNMKVLKNSGVALALDDFGTGYTSLSLARDLPIDVLKIDRRFVYGLGESSKDEAVVKSIITLADSLGIIAIAEGIENMMHVHVLRKMGCTAGQGYLFLPDRR